MGEGIRGGGLKNFKAYVIIFIYFRNIINI